MKRHAAPIIAAVLLLLPVLYVGSYFALVMPGGRTITIKQAPGGWFPYVDAIVHYRVMPEQAERVFWPLEQIDRKVRPAAWDPNPMQPFPPRVRLSPPTT